MDNLEGAAFGGILIVGDGDLAGSSSVSCAAGKGERLGRSQGHCVAGPFCGINSTPLLAREVATVSEEWGVVQSRFSVGNWSVHNHMSAAERREAENGDDRC